MKVVFLDAATLPRELRFDPNLDVDYRPYGSSAPEQVAERIEGASHWMQLDQPKRVNQLLLNFLKG